MLIMTPWTHGRWQGRDVCPLYPPLSLMSANPPEGSSKEGKHCWNHVHIWEGEGGQVYLVCSMPSTAVIIKIPMDSA